MHSDEILKLLSAARIPLLGLLLGAAINGAGDGAAMRNTGAALAYLSAGAAATAMIKADSNMSEIRKLSARHQQAIAAQKKQTEKALAAAKAEQSRAHQQASLHQQAATAVKQLMAQLAQAKTEIETLSPELQNCSATLADITNNNEQLAGELESLYSERMQLIYELYETAVTEADIAAKVAGMEAQFNQDSQYQLTQKKKLKSALTAARADFHSRLAEAEETIEQLESELEQKTQQAIAMIGEIEGDAKGSLTELYGRSGAKDELIASLKQQLDEARKTTSALRYKRFPEVGHDNAIANQLIDFLAGSGLAYGAFDLRRSGPGGRLIVWLDLIDARLSDATQLMDECHAELNLWAKPSVRVDKGRHRFELPTEREHKKIEVPADNLSRIERTFDLANHIRLVGQSGSGKSTFLDNLIWLGRRLWLSACFELLDPKYPFTEWRGGLVPDWKNLECIAAIERISTELQARFEQANEIANTYGNDSPEFERFVAALPYHLFVLDEAQYLYRIARKEDNKQKPKGTQANLVRDSLLDCLGVGRALKVKGLFISQSAKCSKMNMNEDDFDNACSIFLGSAIGNALDGELKASYSTKRLAKVSKELADRRALGQQYLGLVSDLNNDDLCLFQLPQPGYYYSQWQAAQTQAAASRDVSGAAPIPHPQTQNSAHTERTESRALSASQDSDVLNAESNSVPDSAPDSELSAYCPECRTESRKLKGKRATKSGKRTFFCEQSSCKKQTFSAKPIKK